MSTEIIQAPEIVPEADEQPKANPRTGQNALTLGLALLAGSGATLMIVALGIGVVGGEDNQNLVGLLLIIGLGILMGGVIGWAGVVQPWANFDDINEPLYFGHHHEEDHDDDEHADEDTH